MNIVFSHSYRLSFLSRSPHTIQCLAYADALAEDLAAADSVFWVTPETRLKCLLATVDHAKPDAVILNAPHDVDCVKESNLKAMIEARNIVVIGNSPEITALCLDKRATKQWLATLSVPTPPDGPDGHQPVIVKPVSAWGGTGVRAISEPASCPEFFNTLSDSFLVEQYVEGVEMSVQVLRHAGRMIVTPPVYKGRTSLEMIHPLKKLRIFPNPWNPTVNDTLMATAGRIADALDLDCILEIEFIVQSATDFVVTEMNSRLSGVSRMIAAAGLNAVEEMVRMADGTWATDTRELDYKLTAEIPVQGLSWAAVETIPFVTYYYHRPDDAGSRERVLVTAVDLQAIGSHMEDMGDHIMPLARQQYVEAAGL